MALDSLKDRIEMELVGGENKGHGIATLGAADGAAGPGQVDVHSYGGKAAGFTYDESGYNIATAAPGEGHASSVNYPSETTAYAGDSRCDGAGIAAAAGSGAVVGGQYFVLASVGNDNLREYSGAAMGTACCCCVIL